MSTKTIATRIEAVLGRLGFGRYQSTWNRKSDSFVDVVNVQTSKAGDTLTISAGVLHCEVFRKFSGVDPPARVDEPSCTVRARIGELIDGTDLWWPLNDPAMSEDILQKITTYVLPFLSRMHSIEEMEAFLISAGVIKRKYPPPIIYLAILKNERGDRTSACALLAECRKKTVQAWKTRISEISDRLSCS